MKSSRLLLTLAVGAALIAHPMGNFSVNHYARLEPGAHGVAIRYVMDLAEIPTFEMLQQWGPDADLQKKAMEQAREWAAKLEVAVNGKRIPVRVVRAQVALAEGAIADRVSSRSAVLMLTKGLIAPQGDLPSDYVGERVRAWRCGARGA